MNKWQIICPLTAMLIVAVVAGSVHSRNEARGMRAAVETHLGPVLGELERLQENGRFPSVEKARSALQDEAVARRAHPTSLFNTDDLYYNPAQPAIGTHTLVLCARAPGGLFGIGADRAVRSLRETELHEAHFVSLAGPAGLDSPANGSQPVRSETNQPPASAGLRR